MCIRDSFKVERECQITEKLAGVVGVDYWVKTLATLSTGEVFDGAKSYKNRTYAKRLIVV